MKFINLFITVLLTLLFITSASYCQKYEEFNTKDLFLKGGATITTDEDSINDSGVSFYQIYTVAAAADSFVSYPVANEGGGNDLTVYAGTDSISGTTLAYVYFGIYRGIEAGWSWILADSLESDGAVITWDLGAWTNASTRVIDTWGIKLKESGNQRNELWARVKKFKWR